METKTKQALLVAVVSVTLFVALMNFSAVLGAAGRLIDLLLPLIAGAILALFIDVPMSGVEKRLRSLCKRAKKQPSEKLLRALSFLATMICILLALVLVLTMLVPELVRSCQSLYGQIEASIPQWEAALNSRYAGQGGLEALLSGVDWKTALQSISDGADLFAEKVINAFSSTVNILVTASFAAIISIYILLGKKTLCGHAQKLIRAYLKPAWAQGLLHFCRSFRRSFASFLTGQCSEAVILGVLMFLAFTLFRLPYGSLVGVLTAVCAIIPYVGAFISCAVSVFLVLLIAPGLVVRCVVVYFAVQFIENQFIYPRVVGGSVGLSPFYTLIAAMVGGELFGIIGIIFFIPLTAVVLELVREDVRRRLPENRETPAKAGPSPQSGA